MSIGRLIAVALLGVSLTIPATASARQLRNRRVRQVRQARVMKKTQTSWMKRVGAFFTRSAVKLAGIGSSFTVKRRYCLIGGAPVRSVHDMWGRLDIQELNPRTGRFERNMALLTKIQWGGIEVDYVSKKVFEGEVSRIRQSSLSRLGQKLDK